jgi:HSP20 family protein
MNRPLHDPRCALTLRCEGREHQEIRIMKDTTETSTTTPTARLAATHPLLAMREEMDRALARMFGNDPFAGFPRLSQLWDMPSLADSSGAMAAFASLPRSDLSEDKEQFELTVELPGMDEKDLDLSVDDGGLLLKGEKKEEKETKEKDYHLTERSYGSIRRRFPLPPGVDPEKMKATFSKGVLKVVLPKTTQAKASTRKIEVRGG